MVRAIHPDANPHPGLAQPIPKYGGERDDAILTMVRGWVESSGPFTCDELASRLSLPVSDMTHALARLESDGIVLRGSFRQDSGDDEFCDRRVLARIHRSTIDSLRSQVEPVSAATFIRFLM